MYTFTPTRHTNLGVVNTHVFGYISLAFTCSNTAYKMSACTI